MEVGLKLAVEKVKWSKNSVKHVILVGSASFQLEPEGTRAALGEARLRSAATRPVATRAADYVGGEYVVRLSARGSPSSFGVQPSDRFGASLFEVDTRLVVPTEGAYLYLHARRLKA